MTPERFQTLKAALARRQPDLTVLADNVHKPHNIAALMRTCDAVGVFEINAIGPGTSFLRSRGISGGAAPRVGVRMHRHVVPAILELQSEGFQVVAAHLTETAEDYRAVDYTQPTALLLGSELRGVSPDAIPLVDCHASLPMHGLSTSLNVSVAAALFLYEAARQREAAGLYATCRLTEDQYVQTLFRWCHPAIANRCDERGLPYPPLTPDGDLAANPFAVP
ncbi:MAG: tRNA (guanosine(18)-2'-O)-methyltransferase TrmH [Gammaproteobacteria bacterium]|nr:tRNA (guanosine(18)-2'-O)-methyltransferase TrmH [Gammaproteobacteria bacterium]